MEGRGYGDIMQDFGTEPGRYPDCGTGPEVTALAADTSLEALSKAMARLEKARASVKPGLTA